MYRRGSSKRAVVDVSRVFGGQEALLQTLFRAYYRVSRCIEEPELIQHREFAFQPFNSQSYVRHISFDTFQELHEYLRANAPRHAYYSIALYELPEARTMEEKNWLGSDLLFDIDLDHVDACADDSVRTGSGVILIGDKCVSEGYRLALKLAAMLRRDFSPERITIYYTGHRGFHLRVSCDWCRELSREERRMIAQYLAGEHLDPMLIFPSTVGRGGRRPRGRPAVPREEDPGWRGWLAPHIQAVAPGARSLDEAFGGEWEREVVRLVKEAAVPLDIMVTQDPSRLTRLIGSLNGKGGLLVVEASRGFRMDPSLVSPFSGEVVVRYTTDFEPIQVLGVEVQGVAGREEVLPASLAVHFAFKGVVEIVGGEISVGEGSCRRPIQGRDRSSR